MSAFDDLAPFFHADMGAVTARIDDGTPTGREVLGIFDKPPADANLMGQPIPGSGPQFTAPVAALGELPHDTRLSVAGADWYVSEITPDGQGLAAVRLCSHPSNYNRLY